MENLLRRLDKWLQEKRPDFYSTLRPGATDAELNDLEYRIDSKLPKAFRQLYQWKNGQEGEYGFFASYEFMNTDFVIDAWEGEYAELADIVSQGKEFIAGDPNWIPFLFSNGTFICVDLTGVNDGKPGQVIDDDEASHYFILARTLETWLECYVTSLELDYWRPDEEGIEYFPAEIEGQEGVTHYGKLIAQRLPGYPISVERE